MGGLCSTPLPEPIQRGTQHKPGYCGECRSSRKPVDLSWHEDRFEAACPDCQAKYKWRPWYLQTVGPASGARKPFVRPGLGNSNNPKTPPLEEQNTPKHEQEPPYSVGDTVFSIKVHFGSIRGKIVQIDDIDKKRYITVDFANPDGGTPSLVKDKQEWFLSPLSPYRRYPGPGPYTYTLERYLVTRSKPETHSTFHPNDWSDQNEWLTGKDALKLIDDYIRGNCSGNVEREGHEVLSCETPIRDTETRCKCQCGRRWFAWKESDFPNLDQLRERVRKICTSPSGSSYVTSASGSEVTSQAAAEPAANTELEPDSPERPVLTLASMCTSTPKQNRWDRCSVRRLAEDNVNLTEAVFAWLLALIVFAVIYFYNRRVARRKRNAMQRGRRSESSMWFQTSI